jgi:serine/threonine protein kinase HipA of HipAB toxin-antitoxin module
MLKSHHTGRLISTAAVAGVMLLMAACASAPPAPTASLNEARLAIEVAERVDASSHARAELDEARQKLVSADRAVASENMVLADRYAKQATVMAELATAKTEAVKALAVNEEMNRGAKALIEEMQRTGDQQ